MSVNQVRNIQVNPADIQPTNPGPASKKINTGLFLSLVPQRKNFSNETSFQQVMDKYIFHCRRLEMVKKLRDCLNGNEE